jgi:hypothetical protein
LYYKESDNGNFYVKSKVIFTMIKKILFLLLLNGFGEVSANSLMSFATEDDVRNTLRLMLELKEADQLVTLYHREYVKNRFFKLCRREGQGVLMIRRRRSDENDFLYADSPFGWYELNEEEIPPRLIAQIILHL